MKRLLCCSILFLMFFKGIAQGYIPAELIDYSQLSVELSSPFSVSEINLMNQKGDLNGSMKIDFDKYDYYNKVGYRDVNQELIDGFTKANKSNRFVYKRDIEEKKDSSRFLVRSHFNLSSGDKLYFIYDTQTNISYENFYSVKQLIKALEYAYHYKPTASMLAKKSRQEMLDASISQYVLKNKKNKKEMSRGAKITFGVLAYAVFQTLIIVLSNLE